MYLLVLIFNHTGYMTQIDHLIELCTLSLSSARARLRLLLLVLYYDSYIYSAYKRSHIYVYIYNSCVYLHMNACVHALFKVPKIPWMVIIPFATLFLGYAFKSVLLCGEIRLCCGHSR